MAPEREEAIRAAVLAAVTRMDPLGGLTSFREIGIDVEAAVPGVSFMTSREDFRAVDKALQFHRKAGTIVYVKRADATDGRTGWRLTRPAAQSGGGDAF